MGVYEKYVGKENIIEILRWYKYIKIYLKRYGIGREHMTLEERIKDLGEPYKDVIDKKRIYDIFLETLDATERLIFDLKYDSFEKTTVTYMVGALELDRKTYKKRHLEMLEKAELYFNNFVDMDNFKPLPFYK